MRMCQFVSVFTDALVKIVFRVASEGYSVLGIL